MKKITSLIATAVLAMMSMTFVSCDEDSEIAYTLEGTWKGDMQVRCMYDNVVYDALYSEINFARDPYRYSSGRGYWIDYYNRGPWGRDYVANHIEWTVNNGVISVYFVEEGAYIDIHNYTLSDNYFTGVIYDGDQRVNFRLRHTSSPNWNDYYYGWDYYAKQGKADTRGSGQTDKPVRMFGRNVTAD